MPKLIFNASCGGILTFDSNSFKIKALLEALSMVPFLND